MFLYEIARFFYKGFLSMKEVCLVFWLSVRILYFGLNLCWSLRRLKTGNLWHARVKKYLVLLNRVSGFNLIPVNMFWDGSNRGIQIDMLLDRISIKLKSKFSDLRILGHGYGLYIRSCFFDLPTCRLGKLVLFWMRPLNVSKKVS